MNSTPSSQQATTEKARREKARRSLRYWSLTNRIINKQPFAITPPMEAIYDDRSPNVVLRKAAQVYASEYLTNVALYVADTGQGERGNALYVFPKSEQGQDFSKTRIDTAIDASPYLRSRTQSPRNVGVKSVGEGFVYIRGAQTRDQLLSLPADVLLLDEVAQYEPWVLPAAMERLGSSLLRWVRAGSTPLYPADEAARLWEMSSQSEYHLRCSHCGVWQPLSIKDNLNAETARVDCAHCHGDMSQDRLGVGRWVAAHEDRDWVGYQLHKLVSPRADLTSIAATWRRIKEGRATATEEQEFWNSSAGLPHLPAGGTISPDLLDACREVDPAYHMPSSADGGTTMGVDVGNRIHVRINRRERWGDGHRLRAVYIDSVRTFEEVSELIGRYHVRRCVVDANPETRKVDELIAKWKGRVWRAYYPNWDDTQRSVIAVWSKTEPTVHINRTGALDAVATMVGRGEEAFVLPANARHAGGAVDQTGYGEYYRHMGAPVRVLVRNKTGNDVPRYVENGADHFAHAEVYAYVATLGPPTDTAPGLLLQGAANGWGG